MLFHHRALPARNSECGTRGLTACAVTSALRPDFIPRSALEVAAGDGFAPPSSPSKGDVLLLDDPATRGARIAKDQSPIADNQGFVPFGSLAIGHLRLAIAPKALVARQGNAPCSTD